MATIKLISTTAASVTPEVVPIVDLSDVGAKTGTGDVVVFQNTPTITTPTIAAVNGSTAASGTLTLRATTNATDGSVIFESDATTETARITDAGAFLVGATSTVASETARFFKQQNGSTRTIVHNDDAGNAAIARHDVRNDVGSTLSFLLFGSGHAGSGPFVGASGGVTYSGAAHLGVNTSGATPIIFGTTNADRGRILSGGAWLINNTAQASSEQLRVTGATIIDNNSTAALRVTQTGVTGPTLTVDTTNRRVGVNGAPSFTSHVIKDAIGANPLVALDTYDATAGNGTVVTFRRAKGTEALPTAVQSNDTIGVMSARGYGATGFATAGRAMVSFFAAENWTDAAQGARIVFSTTPTGGTATAESMRLSAAGNLGIGNTNPTEKLHVTGNAIISGQLQTGDFVLADAERGLKWRIREEEGWISVVDEKTGKRYKMALQEVTE